VFAAEEDSHREAVYQLKGGKLTCLLRTADWLESQPGKHLRNLGFGALTAPDGGAIALIGYLTDSVKAELLISNGLTRCSLLLDRGRSTGSAIATSTPIGKRFRRDRLCGAYRRRCTRIQKK